MESCQVTFTKPHNNYPTRSECYFHRPTTQQQFLSFVSYLVMPNGQMRLMKLFPITSIFFLSFGQCFPQLFFFCLLLYVYSCVCVQISCRFTDISGCIYCVCMHVEARVDMGVFFSHSPPFCFYLYVYGHMYVNVGSQRGQRCWISLRLVNLLM